MLMTARADQRLAAARDKRCLTGYSLSEKGAGRLRWPHLRPIPSDTKIPAADTPETRYAKTADGVHIAYQVVGDGPVDFVYVGPWFTHLEYRWELPQYARYLRRIASFSRLTLFDKRGFGSSDPVPPDQLPNLETRMDAIGRPTGRTMLLPPLFSRGRRPKTCQGSSAGGQKTCAAPGEGEHRKTCVVDAVARAGIGPSRDRLSTGSAERRWSEGAFSSGGGRESNPPASFRPPTDFEGVSDARVAFRPVTSVFVFGRRPRTCKDL